MKYIISERQYRLLTEDEDRKILKLPGLEVFGDWEGLQAYLNKKGNPLFSISGDLNLRESRISDLNGLVSVGGNLDITESQIRSFNDLVSVGGNFKLRFTDVRSLQNLKRVGGDLDSYDNNSLEDLGELEYVGGYLDLSRTKIQSLGKLKYVGGNLELFVTSLSKRINKEEIRKQIEIGGKIYPL
jgi:hypothetical protein